MVHGHDGIGNYNQFSDVYNLNNEAGKLAAYRDVGYLIDRPKSSFKGLKDLYIYTNNAESAKSAKIDQN
jgi:hypothetical protein